MALHNVPGAMGPRLRTRSPRTPRRSLGLSGLRPHPGACRRARGVSTHGGLAAIRTVTIDIRSQPTTDDPYGNRDDLAEVMALRKLSEDKIRGAAYELSMELTDRRPEGREVTTISARSTLTEVLVLIARGWRQFTIGQIASLGGVSDRTARRLLKQLAAAGVLWTARRGKWYAGTVYSLAKGTVRRLVELVEHTRQFQNQLRDARFTLRMARANRRRRSDHVAKSAPYISGTPARAAFISGGPGDPGPVAGRAPEPPPPPPPAPDPTEQLECGAIVRTAWADMIRSTGGDPNQEHLDRQARMARRSRVRVLTHRA